MREVEVKQKYGNAPVNLGQYNLDVGEMMFYLYLPIKFPQGGYVVPKRLKRFWVLIEAMESHDVVWNKYVYLTVKTMFVDHGSPGNRPGWHVDGYGSNGDLNFIWTDRNPTEFAVQEFDSIPDDDLQSMVAMNDQIKPDKIKTFGCQNLLRLDESVVHRVSETVQPGVRTFVKITVSKHRFQNVGNSINYEMNYSWDTKPRNILEKNIDHGK